MVLGLVGDNCKNESAEECDSEAGGQHDVARGKGGFEFGFGFVVHGFGFGVRQSYNGFSYLRPLQSFFYEGFFRALHPMRYKSPFFAINAPESV
jgi:hypothetical protein